MRRTSVVCAALPALSQPFRLRTSSLDLRLVLGRLRTLETVFRCVRPAIAFMTLLILARAARWI
jgi:hypothetical protein